MEFITSEKLKTLILCENYENYNHEKCDEKIMNRQVLSNSLKRKAVDDICIRPAKLIRSKLSEKDVISLTNSDVDSVNLLVVSPGSR